MSAIIIFITFLTVTRLLRLSRAIYSIQYIYIYKYTETRTRPVRVPPTMATPSKRPRSPPFLPACDNCARSGILPNSIDSERNFCSRECAVSLSWCQPEEGGGRPERCLRVNKTAHELQTQARIQLASRQRMQMLLGKHTRSRGRRNVPSPISISVATPEAKAGAVHPTCAHYYDGLLVFSHLGPE